MHWYKGSHAIQQKQQQILKFVGGFQRCLHTNRIHRCCFDQNNDYLIMTCSRIHSMRIHIHTKRERETVKIPANSYSTSVINN